MRNWAIKRYGNEIVMGNMDIYMIHDAILAANGKANHEHVQRVVSDELSLAPSVKGYFDRVGIEDLDHLASAQDVIKSGRIPQLAEFFRIMKAEHPNEPRIAKVIAPMSLALMMMNSDDVIIGLKYPEMDEGVKFARIIA